MGYTDILTPGQLAERYDTSAANLASLRHFGKGPKWFKLGRRVYYRLEDVLEYERTATEEATA